MAVKAHSSIDIYEATKQFWIGSKASIEALTDVLQGSYGFADDTGAEDFGYYDGAAWVWLSDITGGVITDLDVTETVKFSGDITPSTLTGDVNDYDPTGWADATVIRLESGAPSVRTITGLAGGSDGRIAVLINKGATFNVNLASESGSSSAGNRFSFGSSAFQLAPGRAIALIYDSTATRWRPLVIHDHTQLSNIGTYAHSILDVHRDDTANPHAVIASQVNVTDTGGFFAGTTVEAVLQELGGTLANWFPDTNTWTRTGNHTYTMTGDFTGTYRKGTFIRYKDGGAFEYGVVYTSVHAAGTTTINLIPNTNYAMAAVTITETAFCNFGTPADFPDWFDFAAAPAGFSVVPSSPVYRWKADSKVIHYAYVEANNGTSNATTFTASLPVAPVQSVTAPLGTTVDNGTVQVTPGRVVLTGGSTTITFRKDSANAAWSNTLGKRAVVAFSVEY